MSATRRGMRPCTPWCELHVIDFDDPEVDDGHCTTNPREAGDMLVQLIGAGGMNDPDGIGGVCVWNTIEGVDDPLNVDEARWSLDLMADEIARRQAIYAALAEAVAVLEATPNPELSTA